MRIPWILFVFHSKCTLFWWYNRLCFPYDDSQVKIKYADCKKILCACSTIPIYCRRRCDLNACTMQISKFESHFDWIFRNERGKVWIAYVILFIFHLPSNGLEIQRFCVIFQFWCCIANFGVEPQWWMCLLCVNYFS